jgi:hypothetical protein
MKIILSARWRNGFSREGLELDMGNLIPEVTVSLDGVFWHPLSTDADMQVSRVLFPLAQSVEKIREQLTTISLTGKAIHDLSEAETGGFRVDQRNI